MNNRAIFKINPLDHRDTLLIADVLPGDTIRDVLDRAFGKNFEFMTPTIATINDRPILRSGWTTEIIQPDDKLCFIAVLGEPTTIAYVVAAVSFALSVYTYLSMPDTPEQQQDAERVELIGGQRNVAKLGDPIPVIYGRYRCYPDVAATTFSDFVGTDQYLYQLFCIGHGEFSIIEEPRIDDTTFSSFAGAEYAVYGPGQHNNMLFPTNVVTAPEVQQNELIGLNEYKFVSQFADTGNDKITFRSSDRAIWSNNSGSDKTDSDLELGRLNISAGSTIIISGSVSNNGTFTVVSFEYGVIVVAEPLIDEEFFTGPSSSVIIESSTLGWSGWFSANAAGTTTNRLKFDFGFLNGMLRTEDDGDTNAVSATWDVQYRRIDGSGAPIGPIVGINLSKIGGTRDAIIVSEYVNVTPGRYEVRARRTSKTWFRENAVNTLTWMQSRAYIQGSHNFGDITLLAVILKSSGGVSSGGSNRINVLVERKTSAYNPSTESLDPVSANRSIAWAALDMCTADYGAKKPLSAIDVDKLLELDQLWTSRGDFIGIEINQRDGFWKILQDVLRAGRAKPVNNNGFITFVRDEQEISPNLPMFTPANMLPNSYSETVSYKSGGSDSNDYLIIEYQDEDKDYTTNEVDCILPSGTSLNPKKLVLKGCTNRAQAYREGMYFLANQYYRRKKISFATEMEGFLLNFGDHILVAHDIAFNQFGVVTAYDPLTYTVTLSEPPIFSGSCYLSIRDNSGNSIGVIQCFAAGGNDVILALAPSYTPEPGDMYAFGQLSNIYSEYIVIGISPDGENVRIDCVNEDQRVHTADGIGTLPPNYTDQDLSKVSAIPIIDQVFATTDDARKIIFVNWTSSSGALQFEVEIKIANTDTWQKVGFSKNNKMQYIYEQDAVTSVRVRGWSDQMAGPWNESLVGTGGVLVMITEDGYYMLTEDGEYMTTESML